MTNALEKHLKGRYKALNINHRDTHAYVHTHTPIFKYKYFRLRGLQNI